MKIISVLPYLLAASLAAAVPSAHAGGKGYLGINIQVEGEGAFWNPTLKSVKVADVVPGSPAERAGITVGDLIVEVEGKQVLGAKANDLRPYMQREAGEQLKLLVKKATGEVKPVSVVAGSKPE